jgi:hypothetical protein
MRFMSKWGACAPVTTIMRLKSGGAAPSSSPGSRRLQDDRWNISGQSLCLGGTMRRAASILLTVMFGLGYGTIAQAANVCYQVKFQQNQRWSDEVCDGAEAGTTHQSRQVDKFRVRSLLPKHIYYRAHSANPLCWCLGRAHADTQARPSQILGRGSGHLSSRFA